MAGIPYLAPTGVKGGFACPFDRAVMYLVHSSSVGLDAAYTAEERQNDIVGLQMFPGVIYESNFYKMSPAVTFGVYALEMRIPSDYDEYTRYMDLRNGGVVRWNKGSLDDANIAQLHEETISIHYETRRGGVRLNIADEDLCIKIIRENTGIMSLDDVDWLNMLLVLGLCVTWVGGRVYELGTHLLSNMLKKAGLPQALVDDARVLDEHMHHDYGHCRKELFSYKWFDNVREFAKYMGLEKHLRKYPRSVLPSGNIRKRIHWCSKNVPKLDIFQPMLLQVPREPTRVTKNFEWTRVMDQHQRSGIISRLQAALEIDYDEPILQPSKAYVEKLRPK